MEANVRRMREEAKKAEALRRAAESEKKAPFRLRQFANVPPRVMEPRRAPSTPSRPSSAPARRAEGEASAPRRLSGPPAGAPQGASPSPGWRVSNGFGSLSSPQPKSLNSPAGREPFTPPPRAAPRKPAQARAFSTPVKADRGRSSPAQKWASPDDLGAADREDEAGFDVGGFELLAKQLKQMQGKSTPAKDAQGRPTQLQHMRDSPIHGPLSYSGEVVEQPIPAGYRLMPEQERLETLSTLKPKLADLEDRYRRLPLRIETEGQRCQQRELIQKIADTEEAVKLFSRPAVLVES